MVEWYVRMSSLEPHSKGKGCWLQPSGPWGDAAAHSFEAARARGESGAEKEVTTSRQRREKLRLRRWGTCQPEVEEGFRYKFRVSDLVLLQEKETFSRKGLKKFRGGGLGSHM